MPEKKKATKKGDKHPKTKPQKGNGEGGNPKSANGRDRSGQGGVCKKNTVVATIPPSKHKPPKEVGKP